MMLWLQSGARIPSSSKLSRAATYAVAKASSSSSSMNLSLSQLVALSLSSLYYSYLPVAVRRNSSRIRFIAAATTTTATSTATATAASVATRRRITSTTTTKASTLTKVPSFFHHFHHRTFVLSSATATTTETTTVSFQSYNNKNHHRNNLNSNNLQPGIGSTSDTSRCRNNCIFSRSSSRGGGIPCSYVHRGGSSSGFFKNHRMASSLQSISTNIGKDTNEKSKENATNNVMKSILRVALCQFTVSDDKATNHKMASDYIDMAVTNSTEQGGADDDTTKLDLIVLPEIWNSPYATAAFPEYAEIVPDPVTTLSIGTTSSIVPEATAVPVTMIDPVLSPSSALLQAKAMEHGVYIIGGSIPEREVAGDSTANNSTTTETTRIYNSCCVYDPNGFMIAKHRKVHLFDIDVPGGITFRESDTLSPGTEPTSFSMRVPKLLMNNGGTTDTAITDDDMDSISSAVVTVGIGICYDIRFAEYAMILAQKRNCQVLVYPGAFNMVTGPAHWELLQRARANDNQCYVLTASPARNNLTTTTAATTAATINANTDADNNNSGSRNSTSTASTTSAAPASYQPSKYPPYTAWGHSAAVGPWGDIIATRDETPGIVYAELDLTSVERVRKAIPISNQKRPDLYQLLDTTKN